MGDPDHATAASPGSATRRMRSAGEDRHDLGSALVTPGLVDSHTHPVFAGDRSDEAAARLEGAPYTDGGILRTVQRDPAGRAARRSRRWSRRASVPSMAAGTTTVECKSGYGLSTERGAAPPADPPSGRRSPAAPSRDRRSSAPTPSRPEPRWSDYASTVADEMIPLVAVRGPRRVRRRLRGCRLLRPRRRPSGSLARRPPTASASGCTPTSSPGPARPSSAPGSVRHRSITWSSSTPPAWPPSPARRRLRPCCQAPAIVLRDQLPAGARAARRRSHGRAGDRRERRHLRRLRDDAARGRSRGDAAGDDRD